MSKPFRVALCIAALWVVASTLGAVWRLNQPLPTFDHWAAVEFCDLTASDGLAYDKVWMQHNEHRLAVPRLLFLVDFFLFAGSGGSLLAVTALVQLAHTWLLWSLAMRTSSAAARAPRTTAALIAIALFSAGQMFNFIEPFQVQFVLVYAAATVALAAAVRACAPGARPWWWVVAVGASAVASLSMANGLLVWPLLVFVVWSRRANRTTLAIVATIAAAAVLLWLWGFATSANAELDPTENIGRPWRILAYTACWAGSPFRLWDGSGQVVAGGIVGGIALLAFLGLAGPILARRRTAPPPTSTAVAITGTFLVATSLAIALARSGGALAQAQSERYATPSHLLWVVLCTLGAAHAHRWVRTATTVVAGVLAVALVWQQRAHVELYQTRQERIRQAANGVLCGVRDEASLSLFQIAGFFEPIYTRWLAALQERRWSSFASARFARLGRKLETCFQLADESAAISVIDVVEPIAGTGWGCHLRGWAWDLVAGRPPRELLVVGNDDVIVGLADVCLVREDVVAADPQVNDPRVGWDGYAALASSRLPLRVWVVLADGRACPGATVQASLPSLAPLPIRAAVPDCYVIPHEPVRQLPDASHAAALGIHSGHATLETQLGRIDVGPLPARAGTIGLPVQVGPCNWGMSVHLVDLVTLRRLASIHPPPTHGAWAIWRVEITTEMVGEYLGFVAIDRGWRAGQWLAVGNAVLVD